MLLSHEPIVRSEMLIKRPVEEVFEAFIDPEITTKFWFTKSSDRLEVGKRILWEWEMYGVSDEIYVKDIEKNKRILVESSDGTNIKWLFSPRIHNETFVSIENYGFAGNTEEVLNQCINSMGGYTIVLCGLKAFLEHKIVLNLVLDKAPDAHVNK
ncbi:activator of HSP90 ATPase [Paenibacillus montaniterrae]|uniref:Activator of HSP90 ATPase n=1 Tax=Paenibacillus montaniterrae TaxID=429341 RepID=A0A919YRK8_9BACL|nr:SRPBCC family protein [Paenibacillus montaniterrae]GIP18130.1 activator of HSP90 ATPase [Paenibacillus montaniterrae]